MFYYLIENVIMDFHFQSFKSNNAVRGTDLVAALQGTSYKV